MGRLANSFVLGYHGCDASVAKRAVTEGVALLHSDNPYDWLGPGAYFWESDPLRAWEFATEKVRRGRILTPAVVGAVIDMGTCLDLTNRADLDLLPIAFESMARLMEEAGLPMPANKNVSSDRHEDFLLRFRDCAVFRHLHRVIQEAGLEPFDTVRGIFQEGGSAFPGAGISAKTHTQITVRNNDCIKGLFLPLKAGTLQFS